MKHEIELKMIKDYVDKCAGYDISDKRRDAEIVKFRTLYFKLAKQTTHWSLQKIGNMVVPTSSPASIVTMTSTEPPRRISLSCSLRRFRA
jgi:hypothetical protein